MAAAMATTCAPATPAHACAGPGARLGASKLLPLLMHCGRAQQFHSTSRTSGSAPLDVAGPGAAPTNFHCHNEFITSAHGPPPRTCSNTRQQLFMNQMSICCKLYPQRLVNSNRNACAAATTAISNSSSGGSGSGSGSSNSSTTSCSNGGNLNLSSNVLRNDEVAGASVPGSGFTPPSAITTTKHHHSSAGGPGAATAAIASDVAAPHTTAAYSHQPSRAHNLEQFQGLPQLPAPAPATQPSTPTPTLTTSTAPAAATPSIAAAPSPLKQLPRFRHFSDRETLSRGVDQGQTKGLGIVPFLEGKHIFITGATGFLAKVLVEKILREQPEVGQIYLLIQPRNKKPEQRLQDEVINSGLFEVLRKKHGYNYNQFMQSKLTLVPGNITSKGLGIDENLATQIAKKLQVIVNSAANTNFDARYDTALNINTLGPKRVLEFGKRCPHLQVFLHVSTAYVNGTRQGRTPEMPFRMGDSIAKEKFGKDAPVLDLEKEIEDAERILDDLQYAESETVMAKVMTDFGLERAKAFGWQDTYVFTKAMGEMLLDQGRSNIPVAIVRPSVVESTLFEPFPGWMEGHRMMDPVITGYGKGQLKGFLAKPESVLDVVPCDMVVNAILAAMVKHAGQPGLAIYQVASSVVNPLTLGQLANILMEHFTKSPLLNNDGSAVRIKPIYFIPNLAIFKIFLYLNFTLPLQVKYVMKKWMEILGSLLSAKRLETYFNRLARFKKSSEKFEHLAALYQPYTFYQGRFDITNSLNLHNELSTHEKLYFGFDVRNIDWYHYLFNIHVPGLRQHVMKGRFDS